VLALGVLMEPRNTKRFLMWFATLYTGITLVAMKGKVGKAMGFLNCVSMALLPPGDGAVVRFIYGMASVMRVLRATEMLWTPSFFEERGVAFSLKFAFLYHDLRKATPLANDDVALSEAIVHTRRSLAALVGSIAALHALPDRAPAVLRFVLGALRSWAVLAFVEACYALHLAAFGIQSPVCFDKPLESRTLAEFWNSRWNLAIKSQLSNVFYKPFAEMGHKAVGQWCTFVASAALHICPFLYLGGSRQAILKTAAFFVAQPTLMLVESKLKLSGPGWISACFFGTAPLFIGPLCSFFASLSLLRSVHGLTRRGSRTVEIFPV